MMNRSDILAMFDQEQRKDIEYPTMRREVTPNVVRLVDKSEICEGMVIFSQLDESVAEDTIREQIRYFESLGQDIVWKVYDHDKPADLRNRLQAQGFVFEETEALMVLDLNKTPDLLRQPMMKNVHQIKDPEKITDILEIEHQVWNEDFSPLGGYLREALLNFPDQMSLYIAYVDEQPASAAWIYFPKNSQFASLWGGASLSGYRKQGLYTSLLATRAQEAMRRKVKYLTVGASPMSRPILEKHGFERLDWIYPCRWACKSRQ
jgi:hypothetical protein